jgi:hypothetical protein
MSVLRNEQGEAVAVRFDSPAPSPFDVVFLQPNTQSSQILRWTDFSQSGAIVLKKSFSAP